MGLDAVIAPSELLYQAAWARERAGVMNQGTIHAIKPRPENSRGLGGLILRARTG